MKQIAGRDQWYVARFIADDAPDWNPGKYLRTEEAGPELRSIIVEAEISREKVPLRNAYKHIGQRASLRVNSGPIREITGVAQSWWQNTRTLQPIPCSCCHFRAIVAISQFSACYLPFA